MQKNGPIQNPCHFQGQAFRGSQISPVVRDDLPPNPVVHLDTEEGVALENTSVGDDFNSHRVVRLSDQTEPIQLKQWTEAKGERPVEEKWYYLGMTAVLVAMVALSCKREHAGLALGCLLLLHLYRLA